MPRKTIKIQYGIEIKEPRRIPPWLKMLLVLALIVAGIYAFYQFVIWILAPTPEEILLMEATPTPTATATPEPTPSPTPTPRPSPTANPELSYELMTSMQNGDHIRAWINIPGLGLDTVVAQWSDNEYFKDHDINLAQNPYGAVYIDSRNDISYIEDAGHIIIYGYNNLGGSQLKSMVKYVNEEYFGYNTLIVLENMYGRHNFRLFSVHIEEDDAPYLKSFDEVDKKEFIEEIMVKTMFIPDSFPDEDSVILTFSIDVESAKGTRLLVHAYLEME